MPNILLITSSPRASQSLSTRFATELAEGLQSQLGGNIINRDLVSSPLPHITNSYIVGRMLAATDRTEEQQQAISLAQALLDELASADIVVLGSGMMNFGPSTQLKAWFDYITWPGVSFSYAGGTVKGLLKNKKVYFVTASGSFFSEGPFSAYDFQSAYVKHLLGFIGLTDIEQVHIEGTARAPEALQTAIDNVKENIRSLIAAAA